MTIDMGKLADRAIGQRMRAYIDGVEITNRCFYASEEDGIARCYIMVSDGANRRMAPRRDPETETECLSSWRSVGRTVVWIR